MTEIVERHIAVAIDTEIIQEVLYRYGAIGRWQIGATMATDLLDIIPTVYPILVADTRKAVELFNQYAKQGVKARDLIHVAVMSNNGLMDLIHVAVMSNNGLMKIISTDAHFDRVEGIVRLDPQTMFAEKER
jgi:predicted nucleic acid-binding protein